MTKKSKIEQQRERRARYVQGWRALGIHDKIIAQYDLRNKNPDKISDAIYKEIKKESRTAKTRETKQRNAQRRYNEFLASGYNSKDIKKDWLTSDKKMYKAMGRTNPNEVYKASSHLALAFTNRHGATAIMDTSAYKHLSFSEIKERIQERINEAYENPDGSEQMSCIFQMFSGSESECDYKLEKFSERGYNLSVKKLTDRRYYRLVNRNDWTMREYAEMILCVIEQAHNEHVPGLVEEFRDFIDKNDLPFDEIFT